MPADLVNRFRHKFQRPVVHEHPFEIVEGFFLLTEITKDGYCVFLTEDKLCAIYEDRPEICRKFGQAPGVLECHRVTRSGRVRSPEEAARALKRIQKLEKEVDNPIDSMIRGYDIQ